MAVEIGVWNVAGALGDNEREEQALEKIKRLDADVVILPEACKAGLALDTALMVQTQLGSEYVVAHVEYEDKDDRLSSSAMLLLNRLPADSLTTAVRIGSRNAIYARVIDPGNGIVLRGLGVHFDDRSEATRLLQAREAFYVLRDSEAIDDIVVEARNHIGDRQEFDGPQFIAGVLNSMPRRLVRARLGRSALRLPAVYPTFVRPEISRFDRAANIASRLGGMSSGRTLQYLESVGFMGADPSHSPTWPARWPLAQLDHIMVAGDARVSMSTIHDDTGLSDHRAITATIET